MISPQKNPAARRTKTASAAPLRRLHSLHTLLEERDFVGVIEAGRLRYEFTYAPRQIAAQAGKLALTGTVRVKTPAGKVNETANVRAELLAVQAAVATATRPPAFKIITTSALPTDPQDELPLTEATGTRSAVGVLYLKLAPLDGRALGLPYDVSKLQLNGRIAALDQTARDLQWLFNQAIAALGNPSVAEPYLTEIERLLHA